MKWMVSSTAMPTAITETGKVAIESGMPNSPITPKLMMIGSTLGTIARKPALTDEKSRLMQMKIGTSTQPIEVMRSTLMVSEAR